MKNYTIGETVNFTPDDFEGFNKVIKAVITEVHDDFAIAMVDGYTLYIDEDTDYQFTK